LGLSPVEEECLQVQHLIAQLVEAEAITTSTTKKQIWWQICATEKIWTTARQVKCALGHYLQRHVLMVVTAMDQDRDPIKMTDKLSIKTM